jgi:metal-sulfur cluster biosynthetic enzyme
MDKRTWRQFKPYYSVEDLEIRFQLEDEWEAQGLTPNARKKDFREALKERLAEEKSY